MPGIEALACGHNRQGFRHGRYALLMVEDNRSTSVHRSVCARPIGVTNRIRTGTNAFTGRDAAVTS